MGFMTEHGIFLAVFGLLLTMACIGTAQSGTGMAVRHLSFDSHNAALAVEIADTPQEIDTGLMGRTHLDENSGMLFDLGSVQTAHFYMYRTLIPLDAVFLDGDMKVVDIQTMTPCKSENAKDCPWYNSRAPVRFVLEVNAGWAEKEGIAAGDTARLND